jgi:hypothetical protein
MTGFDRKNRFLWNATGGGGERGQGRVCVCVLLLVKEGMCVCVCVREREVGVWCELMRQSIKCGSET